MGRCEFLKEQQPGSGGRSTAALPGPPGALGGEYEQPDEVDPAHRSADQSHRNLERTEKPLRQKISPAQQQRPHRRRGDQRLPADRFSRRANCGAARAMKPIGPAVATQIAASTTP